MPLCIRQGSKRNDWVSVEELDWSAESQVLIPAEHLWCDFKCRPWAKKSSPNTNDLYIHYMIDWTRMHALVVMHRRTLYENVDSAKIKVPFYTTDIDILRVASMHRIVLHCIDISINHYTPSVYIYIYMYVCSISHCRHIFYYLQLEEIKSQLWMKDVINFFIIYLFLPWQGNRLSCKLSLVSVQTNINL